MFRNTRSTARIKFVQERNTILYNGPAGKNAEVERWAYRLKILHADRPSSIVQKIQNVAIKVIRMQILWKWDNQGLTKRTHRRVAKNRPITDYAINYRYTDISKIKPFIQDKFIICEVGGDSHCNYCSVIRCAIARACDEESRMPAAEGYFFMITNAAVVGNKLGCAQSCNQGNFSLRIWTENTSARVKMEGSENACYHILYTCMQNTSDVRIHPLLESIIWSKKIIMTYECMPP